MLRGMLLAVVLLAPAAYAQSGASCEDQGEVVICRWRWEATGTMPGELAPFEEEVPSFALTLATINVVLLQAPDTGWTIELIRYAENETRAQTISISSHPARETFALRHEEQSTHVFATYVGDTIALRLRPGNVTGPEFYAPGLVSGGIYEITYIANVVPEGSVPSRPAATVDDPHLPDESGEVAHAAWDIQAAWWDDERLGDGLMQAYVKLDSLEAIPPEAYDPPVAQGVPLDGPRWLQWKLAWTVLGTRYFVEWELPRGAPPEAMTCILMIEGASEAEDIARGHPLCSMDAERGILSATFPIALIGAPPDGEKFLDPAARTRIEYALVASSGFRGRPEVVDHAETEAFLFALGGPAVWSGLNPRLDPPVPQWYEDPLAPEHVLDTVQGVGSLAALATFLVGLVLIWRRRRYTSQLLALVDAVAEEHADQRQALLALGRLEEEFAGMFRRHRISEGQYQVLSQRIATVATRYALRTSLGLDDGVPGEAGPTSVRIRRN